MYPTGKIRVKQEKLSVCFRPFIGKIQIRKSHEHIKRLTNTQQLLCSVQLVKLAGFHEYVVIKDLFIKKVTTVFGNLFYE